MSRSSPARARTILVLLVVCAGCSGGTADDEVFTAEERALIRKMVLDPMVAPPTDVSNEFMGPIVGEMPMLKAVQAELVSLGQQLFFDDGLAGVGLDGNKVGCVTCHLPSHAFSDGRADNAVSAGIGWTRRNSPGLVNVGYYVSFGWDGRADALWAQGKHAFEAGATMSGDKLVLVQQVARRYGDRYQRVFGSLPADLQNDGLTRFTLKPRDAGTEAELDGYYRNILKAWGAYLLQLNAGNAPFDRFAMGEEDALDTAQRRGLHVFLGKAGCISCHLGPNFTDNLYHSVGVAQSGPHAPAEDLGRFTGLQEFDKATFASYRVGPPREPTTLDKGLFRTKSLRQVAQTPPYFHAGQMPTLADVVWFYNQGGDQAGAGMPDPLLVPLGLTSEEQADLVAFLGSLTGTAIDPKLTCNSARSPAAASTTTRCASIP